MSRDGFPEVEAGLRVDNKEEGKRVSGKRGQHVQRPGGKGENLSLLRMWMSLSDIGAEWLHFLLL